MRFALSEESTQFADAVAGLLAAECDASAIRASWQGSPPVVEGLWSKLAEMGVIGLCAPESVGGMSASPVDLVAIFEEVGFAATPGPLIEHCVFAVTALAEGGDGAEALLNSAAAGECTISVVDSGSGLAPFVSSASHFAIEGSSSWRCVSADAVSVTPQPNVDTNRDIGLVEVQSSAPNDGVEVLAEHAQRARELATLAAAAQLVGVARRILADSTEYAKERHQFGKPDRCEPGCQTPAGRRIEGGRFCPASGLACRRDIRCG